MASRRLIVAMFTGIAVTAVAGVAYATDNSSHPSPSPSSFPGGSHPGFGGGGPFGGGGNAPFGRRPMRGFIGGPGGLGVGGPGGGPFGIEHGRFVIAKDGGGTQTEVIQNGTATEVTAKSITVKSADNYTHSYVINSSTHQITGCSSSKLAQGDTVTVIASVEGATDTAISIAKRMTFTAPAPGATPSARPTPSGTSAPAGGFCGPGFGRGPGGFGNGPGRFGHGTPPSGFPTAPPSGFPTTS